MGITIQSPMKMNKFRALPKYAGVYPSILLDLRFSIQDWNSLTNGHGTTCVSMLKIRLGVQMGRYEPLLGVQGRNPRKLLLFWCPNMLKQPDYGKLFGLISPHFKSFLLRLSWKTQFKFFYHLTLVVYCLRKPGVSYSLNDQLLEQCMTEWNGSYWGWFYSMFNLTEMKKKKKKNSKNFTLAFFTLFHSFT